MCIDYLLWATPRWLKLYINREAHCLIIGHTSIAEMLSKHRSHSHGQQTKIIGLSVRLLQLNCEEMSRFKSEYISCLAREGSADIICLQELLIDDVIYLNYRVKADGFKVATYTLSSTHGYNILVKTNIT